MFIGLTITAISAAIFYLASPHQKVLSTTLSGKMLLSAGGLLLIVAYFAFLQSFSIGISLFAEMTVLMFFWGLVPAIIAWCRARQERG